MINNNRIESSIQKRGLDEFSELIFLKNIEKWMYYVFKISEFIQEMLLYQTPSNNYLNKLDK